MKKHGHLQGKEHNAKEIDLCMKHKPFSLWKLLSFFTTLSLFIGTISSVLVATPAAAAPSTNFTLNGYNIPTTGGFTPGWTGGNLGKSAGGSLFHSASCVFLHLDGAAFDAVYDHILHMADTLSEGIILQFPARFEADAS